MKKFIILYHHDEDGGFGDCISTIKPVCIFDTEEMAKEYVEKYSKETVYDIPYDKLYTGRLSYREIEHLDNTDKEIIIK